MKMTSGENTEGFLGSKNEKEKQNKNVQKWEIKNMGCHISLTPFLAVVSPRAATMAKY